MKGKYAITATALLCLATWVIAWELYDTQQLWQTIPNMKYQNYLVLSIVAEAGLSLLGYVYMQKQKLPQRIEVPKPPREQELPTMIDPPEESSFIQLVARVNGIENELPKMKKDIEQIRVFKTMCPQPKEEAKPNVQTNV